MYYYKCVYVLCEFAVITTLVMSWKLTLLKLKFNKIAATSVPANLPAQNSNSFSNPTKVNNGVGSSSNHKNNKINCKINTQINIYFQI